MSDPSTTRGIAINARERMPSRLYNPVIAGPWIESKDHYSSPPRVVGLFRLWPDSGPMIACIYAQPVPCEIINPEKGFYEWRTFADPVWDHVAEEGRTGPLENAGTAFSLYEAIDRVDGYLYSKNQWALPAQPFAFRWSSDGEKFRREAQRLWDDQAD